MKDEIKTGLLQDERIEAYLKGKMSSDEEQLFLQELKLDSDLRDRAIFLARLAKGMKEVGIQRDEKTKKALSSSNIDNLKRIIQNEFQKRERETKPIPMRRHTIWLSIAASFIVIVWLGIGFVERQKFNALADEYTDVFAFSGKEASDNYRSLETDFSETEKKLEELFSNITNKKNLRRTLQELSHLWDLSIQDGYNEYTPYAFEIGGNLALGYLKKGERKKAKEILNQISKLPSSSEREQELSAKGEELLEKL